MSEDVGTHIRSCDRCTRFKQPQERAQMVPIQTSYPLELIHLDFLTIGQGTKTVNVLVITDHFTRYAQAYITPKQTVVVAGTACKALWVNFQLAVIFYYGWIRDSILTHRSLNEAGKVPFENKVLLLMKELCIIS